MSWTVRGAYYCPTCRHTHGRELATGETGFRTGSRKVGRVPKQEKRDGRGGEESRAADVARKEGERRGEAWSGREGGTGDEGTVVGPVAAARGWSRSWA